MEPNKVIEYFVDLCNNHAGFLQQNIADNAVLEWFGRTIRGSNRIHNYFRHDLCPQYEHIFTLGEACSPIETKKQHLETMKSPKKNTNTHTESDRSNEHHDHNEFDTPPQKINTPALPELQRGNIFLPTKDDLINNLNSTEIAEAVTPPPNMKTRSTEFGEPSHKKLKLDPTDKLNDKQVKSFDTDNIYQNVKKLPTTSNKKDSYNNDSSVVMDKIIELSNTDNNYSNLLYCETKGVLKLKSKSKHRGITNIPRDEDGNKTNQINCINNTPKTTFGWERKTKIKFSYRLRKEDNHIQFALIIYEHLDRNSMMTRRNLLEEFQKTDKIEKNIPEKVKRKTPLKRTLRLF